MPVFFLFLLPVNSLAQTELRGNFQNYTALQTTDDYDFIAIRNRLQLQFGRSANFGRFYTEKDILQRYHESVEPELFLRELYIDWYAGDYDIRIGKQKVIWGRSDAAFVTDILTPLDLREFVTDDPADIRFGIPAISVERYFGLNSLQLVLNPIFQPHLLPDQDSRWFPVLQADLPLEVHFEDSERKLSARNFQFAAQYRWRTPSRLDLDLMIMRWAYPVPAFSVNLEVFDFPDLTSLTLQENYHPSLMAGFSGSLRLTDNFYVESETLFVNQRLFTSLPFSPGLFDGFPANLPALLDLIQNANFLNNDSIVKKPWLHSMAGLQTEIFSTTVRAQAHLEFIFNYDEDILSEEYFPYFSLLATRSFMRDRMQLIALTRYQPEGEDFWFQFQANYELADGFEFSLGTNLFGGNEPPDLYGHFSFYPFRKNSSLFTRFAYYF